MDEASVEHVWLPLRVCLRKNCTVKYYGGAKARQRRDLALGPPCASTLGANPCNPMFGKPTVATVAPSLTAPPSTNPETRLCKEPAAGYLAAMSTVQEIEAAIPGLSRAEIEEIRAWIDDFLEDQLELTDEVKAKLDESRREIAAGNFTGGIRNFVFGSVSCFTVSPSPQAGR